MPFRIVADENVAYRTVTRLLHYDYEVDHVDFINDLGKGRDEIEQLRMWRMEQVVGYQPNPIATEENGERGIG
jgi:hypothetical protein